MIFDIVERIEQKRKQESFNPDDNYYVSLPQRPMCDAHLFQVFIMIFYSQKIF